MDPQTEAMMGGSNPAADLSLIQMAVYAFLGVLVIIMLFGILAVLSLPVFFMALLVLEVLLKVLGTVPFLSKFSKLGGLVFRSLKRNFLRTALTYVALFILTGMLTMIYGVVKSIGKLTTEKEGSQLVLLTEKFSIPSQMKPGYFNQLVGVIEELPPEYRPRPLTQKYRDEKGLPSPPEGSLKFENEQLLFSNTPDNELTDEQRQQRAYWTKIGIQQNTMTWSFVGATLDINKLTKENTLFLFALDPESISNGMMAEQGLTKEDLGEDNWSLLLSTLEEVKADKRNIVIGEDRLRTMNKSVGDNIKLFSTNYRELEFECKIVGAFPSGSRLGNNAAMRYDYLTAKLNDFESRTGKAHDVAEKCLNLVWVRMPSKESYENLAEVVSRPDKFNQPAVKMETFSAVVGSFLDSFKDIFWGMKYIVMPAIVLIMCLVIGITITISVRERWTEMAVLKVLGFKPFQIMAMIISEAMLIGVFGGLLSTWSVYFLPKIVSQGSKMANIKFTFFDNFDSPIEIVIIGPLLGVAIGMIGAALPSWNARKVKVSDVFSKIA